MNGRAEVIIAPEDVLIFARTVCDRLNDYGVTRGYNLKLGSHEFKGSATNYDTAVDIKVVLRLRGRAQGLLAATLTH